MRLISCHDGKLLALSAAQLGPSPARTFVTGLAPIDALLPGGAFACGSVHELLTEPGQGSAFFFAALLAYRAASPLAASQTLAPAPTPHAPIVWCDPKGELYPPALSAHGIRLDQLFLLHPAEAQQVWAVCECLRCKGVSAVVAAPPCLSRVEARRLQLSAERGGGVGLLLRTAGPGSTHYAAATRWLIRPTPGERTVQRWNIQLIHGHGGRVGQTVILEYHRETNLVRAAEQLADRPSQKKSRPITRSA